MNLALAFNDIRYWTPGSYIKRELSKQNEIDIVMHARIPEDTGLIEEQCGLNINLMIVIDDGVSHFKIHHHIGKISKDTRSAIWLSDLHRPDWSAWRLQMIKEWHYDHVFYAQKNFRDMIKKCGYSDTECSFLPHAVDPEIFKPISWIEKRYDVGYVGYLNDRRKQKAVILKDLMNFKHFNSVWELNANRCLQECKIGFNISVEDDINMRVFETMAAGIPLLTNDLRNNGMEDLFGKDLEDKMLLYSNDAELKEKAVRLLANPELRKQLSEKARLCILQNHTYRNRINSIFGTMGFPLLKNY